MLDDAYMYNASSVESGLLYHPLQAELTFSAGDVIYVFGDMDDDGFFYVSVQAYTFSKENNAAISHLNKNAEKIVSTLFLIPFQHF